MDKSWIATPDRENELRMYSSENVNDSRLLNSKNTKESRMADLDLN